MAELAGLQLVQIAQRIQGAATHGAVHAGRIADVEHGVALGPALHALENRGQETGAPDRLARRSAGRRC
jgi:hypothetical protein